MHSPRLEYAPTSRLPWYRRQTIQRRLIWLCFLLIALIFLARAAPPFYHHLQARLILRRCLHFTAPADKLAYDADPTRALAFTAANKEYRNELAHDLPDSPVASWQPPDWVALLRHVDSTLTTFRLSPPLVFMHERTSPHGDRLLVVMRFSGNFVFEASPAVHIFDIDLFDPAAEPSLHSVRSYQSTMRQVAHRFTRLYFAQPDPADASHFFFRYETEDGAGIIDAWLRNDHEIKLECRDGPEKLAE